MLIEFNKDVFENPINQNRFSLIYNLAIVDRRYNIFVDVADVREMPLYLHLTDGDKAIIDDYFVRHVQENGEIDYLVMEKTGGEQYQLDLVEAEAFFNQPLTIVLENSQNDKYFFEAIIRNFKKRGKTIARHLSNRWIRYGNGGGCTNVQKFLEERIASFEGLPKIASFYIRCFVLIDSDSQYPGEVRQERAKLLHFLEQHKIPFHILIKREMENYIPDEVFSEADGNVVFKKNYLELNALQKDYLDIERGLKAVDIDNKLSPIHKLYSDLSQEQLNAMRNKGLLMDDFKNRFPLLFTSEKVTQKNLMSRTAHQGEHADELGNILDKINELI